MQHPVGSPLPPPHQPGHGPAAGWSPAAHHPGPQQGPAAPLPPHPAPDYPTRAPVPPAPPRAAAPQPAPGPAPGAHQPPPAPHVPDTTGHVRLPPGAPVAVPSVPPAMAAAPDATTTTLAVLLIGPAGAGKTSVAKYWADHRRVPTAHISLDDVREWVRSGFADPQTGWNEHSEAQYRLARRTCGFSARNFLANGISCILDDAVFPDRPVVGLGGWKRHVGPGLLPVVLLPGLDVVLERNAERSGNRRLTDEEVARIHGRMAGWYGSGLPIIDNSQLDVPETAQLLNEVLSRSIASPPTW
ncbi:ATP-binding protein [Streptomyces parvulus]|uniref:Pro-rich N-terminal domain-containing protein n=4 Tax=Streptomyces TaxID=1883 RepID=A0ABV5DB99_9ACTN|nr:MULTISPECIES: Pro-rich N-terminal domain-containing protein [Streptomyces]MCC9153179.1 ATP-binding protein [Streptomyces parvulus]MCE7686480.1 ATP-binding protein [Streptomyces parvulus]WHM33960.1 Pro-rich N-terminal domain-containing protein [Streptomyces sp. BPPL-273]WML79404.1 Pro-rich N-terminal domain-containing protein [Streptomyces sp. VNUA74]